MKRLLSDETKQKISAARKGQKLLDETKKKLSLALKGKPSSMKGKHHTPEALAKMSQTWFRKGHKPTQNCLNALSARRGIKRPPFSSEWRANISKAKTGLVSRMKGKRFSEEARLNIKAAQNRRVLGKRGPGTPRWIDDRTKLKTSRSQMYDSRYKAWMMEVKNRDGWRCKINDAFCHGRVEAHHILPWAKYPELRYQPNNGITLCHHHHPRSRLKEMEMSPYFQSLVANA